MNPKFVVLNDDDEEVELPCHFEVCPRCEGKGVHDHPAFSNGLTARDFDEDPDFAEAYFSGRYDVTCSECKGERVVAEVDEDKLTEEQKRLYKEHLDSEYEARAEQRYEY